VRACKIIIKEHNRNNRNKDTETKMPIITLIDKTGKIKDQNIKTFSESELYKKANYKSPEGFSRHHIWNITIKNKTYRIGLYAKNNGKAGQENKFDFPPPVDTVLYFGTCILVHFSSETADSVVDFPAKDWEMVYENLMGGFEDINGSEEDEEDEEDEEEYTGLDIGCDGYARDGFIVDDEEDVDYDNVSEEEQVEEEEEYTSKKKKSSSTKTKKPRVSKISGKSKSKKTASVENSNVKPKEEDEVYLDCQSELTEEQYLV
jgi:hypothetical protein